jgi:capsular polysaccharide biosynthesis protein
MDLLSLFSVLWRHKWTVLVVSLLVIAGDIYIAVGIPPQYESQAQYVVINPPPVPTDAEIQRNPALGRLNTDNPYLRMPNPSVVVDVLAQRMSGDLVRRDLVAKGADRGYQVTATNAIGSGLVILIIGTGHSPAESYQTVDVVSKRMQTELRNMQKINGADDRFLIQALPISPPTPPSQKVTGTIRSMIAVLAAGVVFLFALISVFEAIPGRRTRRPRDEVDGQVLIQSPHVQPSDLGKSAVGRASVQDKI